MQVVVPAAGRGRRFVEQGFKEPKPLIRVMGKPLIKWSTDGLMGARDLKFIFLVLQDHIDSHQIDRQLGLLYPGAKVVLVKSVTEGAACTVLLAKDYLDMDESMMIVNCDNLFMIDIRAAEESLEGDDKGMIFYFASNKERWSYVAVNERGLAERVAEKEVISDKATVGAYYFAKARYFVEAAEYMIERNMRTKGEFYVCPVYNVIIEQGGRIRVFPCDLHYSLGTPEEVANFEELFAVRERAVR